MKRSIPFLFLGAVALFACQRDKSDEPGNRAPTKSTPHHTTAQVTPEAREVFNSRCATCHGTEGKGNGPAAAALNPKPRNYTDKSWQKTVTDDQIKKTITMGGAAVGKSPIMPASPDLESNEATLDGLVAIVRQFGS